MDNAEDFHRRFGRIHTVEYRIRIAYDRKAPHMLDIGGRADGREARQTFGRPTQSVLDPLCSGWIMLGNRLKDAVDVGLRRRREAYPQARFRRQKASISASDMNSPRFA